MTITAAANTAAVGPSPKMMPLMFCGFLILVAKEAPSGRVTTYYIQNAAMLFRPSCHHAIAGSRITTEKMIPEDRSPRLSDVAVKSPSAVPRAKVAKTVDQ